MSKNQTFEDFQTKSSGWLRAEARIAAYKGTRLDPDDLLQEGMLAAWHTISTGGSQELAASRAMWAIRQSARKGRLVAGREQATDPGELRESTRQIRAQLASQTAQQAFEGRFEDATGLVRMASRPLQQAWQLLQDGSATSWTEAAERLGLSRYQLRDGLRSLAPRHRQQADLSDLPLFAAEGV